MSNLSKRSTIYFDPSIQQTLKVKAASSHRSVSELVDDAVRLQLLEDHVDLKAVADRADEPEVSYETMLSDLKKHGKI